MSCLFSFQHQTQKQEYQAVAGTAICIIAQRPEITTGPSLLVIELAVKDFAKAEQFLLLVMDFLLKDHSVPVFTRWVLTFWFLADHYTKTLLRYLHQPVKSG